MPSTPYPPITESTSGASPDNPQPSSRRASTLIYGSPPIQDGPSPVGPPPAAPLGTRPSLADEDHDAHSFANDDADTILNPAAPSAEDTSLPPASQTDDASSADLKPGSVATPAVKGASPDTPRSFSDDEDLIPSKTHHVPGHAQTEVDPQPAGIHSAPTEEASTPTSQSENGPAVGAPIPEFDDDTEQNPPSVSAEFFGNDASGAIANGPATPSESAAFFSAPGPGDNQHESSPATEAATTTTAPVANVATASAAHAESTERIDRTAPGGSPLSGLNDDDDEFAAVVQRSKRNTLIAAVAVLLLLLGSVAGAFAIGVFDEAPEQIAKGAGRDITKDPRRELYTTGKDTEDKDSAGKDAADDDKGKTAEASDPSKASSPKSGAPEADSPSAAKEPATGKKATTGRTSKTAVAKSEPKATTSDRSKDAASSARDDDDKASSKATEKSEEPRSRRRSRSRSRKGTTTAAKTETPTETKDVAAAANVSIPVKAPAHIRWRTVTGKELGRGNTTLSAAPGTRMIVAYDPRRGVKTKVSVAGGKSVDYQSLPSGTLEIRVFPFADVYIGKEKIGTTPFAPLRLVAGKYKLKLKNGAKTRNESVTIRPGKIKRVKVNFNAP